MARELQPLTIAIRKALSDDPNIPNSILATRLGCDAVKVSIQRQALKRKTVSSVSSDEDPSPTVLTKRQTAIDDLRVLKRLVKTYNNAELEDLIDLVR